jgi:short-subunit dehydrogenase
VVASRHMAAYNVAKAGVVALTESLHKDLYGMPVGVSVLCPMRVSTDVWESSAQNRSERLGGQGAYRRRSAEETAKMSGTILDAAFVAEGVLDAVRHSALYILPHEEARPIVRRRFDKIDAAFGRQGA